MRYFRISEREAEEIAYPPRIRGSGTGGLRARPVVALFGNSNATASSAPCSDPAERYRISAATEGRRAWSALWRSKDETQLIRLALFTVLPAVTRADPRHILRASFPDGTGVEIRTETAGGSQIDSEGEMGIGPGVGSQDLVNRLVLDRGQ